MHHAARTGLRRSLGAVADMGFRRVDHVRVIVGGGRPVAEVTGVTTAIPGPSGSRWRRRPGSTSGCRCGSSIATARSTPAEIGSRGHLLVPGGQRPDRARGDRRRRHHGAGRRGAVRGRHRLRRLLARARASPRRTPSGSPPARRFGLIEQRSRTRVHADFIHEPLTRVTSLPAGGSQHEVGHHDIVESAQRGAHRGADGDQPVLRRRQDGPELGIWGARRPFPGTSPSMR